VLAVSGTKEADRDKGDEAIGSSSWLKFKIT
jgi:hypothetical protein